MKSITKIHQRACNEQEFVALIEKYESITFEELQSAWITKEDCNNAVATIRKFTGFGFRITCTLCIKCKRQFSDEENKCMCNECVYGVRGILNLQNQCNSPTLKTYDSYMAIENAKTPGDLYSAIRSRALRMREIFNQYLILKGKMKKTIFVVYGSVSTATKAGTYKSAKEAIADKNAKKYSFNTKSDVKVGDVVKSAAYTTNLIVVSVLDKSFKYYNAGTGDLTNELTSTRCYAIKYLKIIEGGTDEEVVGSIVKDI